MGSEKRVEGNAPRAVVAGRKEGDMAEDEGGPAVVLVEIVGVGDAARAGAIAGGRGESVEAA